MKTLVFVSKNVDSYKFLKYILNKYYSFVLDKSLMKKNIYGKPYIPNFDYNFNISHSDDLLIIGFNKDIIGVDCEVVSDIDESISDIYLRDKRLWTIYESYIKAIGKGLYIDTKKICIDSTNNTICSEGYPTMYYATNIIDNNYVSICTFNKINQIDIFREVLVENG